MHLKSIGTGLTIWYTTLLTLTFFILGSIAYGLLAYSLSRDIDSALKGVAEVMVQRTRTGDAAPVPGDVDELFRRFFGFSPLDRYVDLFDPRGRRDPRLPHTYGNDLYISPEALENASQGLHTIETMTTTGVYPVRVLTIPVIEAGRVASLVRVGMSLENMVKTRRRFLLIMASVFPFGLLFAGGGGWLLARRALRPVDHMTRTARRISAEHIDERLPVTGNGDELDRLAKTLNDMLDRLDDAFYQMRQFSADASHELQTPLTILKGEIEVALRSHRSPEEYKDVLKSGLEEIDRINHLVEGLLLLARADAGVMRMDIQPVDLKMLIRDVCNQMMVIADEHSIALHSGPMESVVVDGDREHLRRTLLNLVDNAIKYTPAGGRVTLTLSADDRWASLSVTDTGIGFPADERQLIFDRFHRATDTRSRDAGGVGLGLSIVRSIAKAHGGRIEAESPPGHGSTFTLFLPASAST